MGKTGGRDDILTPTSGLVALAGCGKNRLKKWTAKQIATRGRGNPPSFFAPAGIGLAPSAGVIRQCEKMRMNNS